MHLRNDALKSNKFQVKLLKRFIKKMTHKLPITRRSSIVHPRITYQNVTFITPLQALPVIINIGRDVTIVSVCN